MDESTGELIRQARRRAGLRLEDLGARTGWSASQVSRYERGVTPLTDVRTIRRFAEALHIPPHALGLSDAAGPATEPPADGQSGGGELRRREMLASLAATAAAASTVRVGTYPREGSAGRDLGSVVVARIRDAMLGLHRPGTDPTADVLRDRLAEAEAHFAASRYSELADVMPRLIVAGQALGTDMTAVGAIAQIYTLATRILIKLDDQQVAWMAADRARTYAAGQTPLVAGEATRWLAVLARKAGAYPQAISIALEAADDPGLRGDSPELLAERGLLIQSAAYTAAKAGDGDRMREWTDETARIAALLGGVQLRSHGGGLSRASVELHRISAEYSIGEPGAALAAAKRIPTTALPTTERRSRYWTDVARANALIGRRDDSIRAILRAEHIAPEEIHARPAIRDLVTGLLVSGRTAPELWGLAARCGIR